MWSWVMVLGACMGGSEPDNDDDDGGPVDAVDTDSTVADTDVDTDTDTDTDGETGCVPTFEGADGAQDLTDTLAAGTEAAPVALVIDEAGTLTLCEGTVYASIHVTVGDFTLQGQGADLTTLSAAGLDSVVVVSEGDGTVLIEDITLADGYNCGGSLVGMNDKLDPAVCGPNTVYPRSDVTLRRVVATGASSRLPAEAEAILIGNNSTLTLEDSVVTGSTGVGVGGYSSTLQCTGSGIYGHASNGIQFLVSGSGSAAGDDCDFGTGDDANGAPDVVLFKPGDAVVSEDYEGVVDFSCTYADGC